MQRVVVLTEDGSSSVFVPELQESYHSKFGSVQESRHVFIDAGLADAARLHKDISILEVGFGTGLNAFLTHIFSLENDLCIHYHAIESFPLEKEVYSVLNYTKMLNRENEQNIFMHLHEADWNKEIWIRPAFSLYKYQISLQHAELNTNFDVIFFDAFAPRVQPELWTADIFNKLYAVLKPGGILVTYCAKGEVKRNMKAAGFRVEALPGPKGKREMTRAIK